MACNEKTCDQCGTAISRPRGYSQRQWEDRRFCSPSCRCLGRRAVREHHSGYRRVWLPGHPLAGRSGYVLQHRLVAYEAGWDVPPGHHVHHKNGDPTDNRVENLEVLPQGEHQRLHIRRAGYVVNQFGTWPLKSSI